MKFIKINYLRVLMIALIIFFGFVINGFASVFNDVPEGCWAEKYINAIFYYGITLGCVQDNPNTSENERQYCPEEDVTRGQMAAFIIRAEYGENFSYTPTPYFIDVPSTHTFFKYVQKLKDDGITAVSDVYNVDGIVTRGQMAAFIIRAKYGENFSYTPTPYFIDVPSTHLFFKYVQKLKDDGITAVSDVYNVDGIVTRDQMAAFLSRAFLGIDGGGGIPECPDISGNWDITLTGMGQCGNLTLPINIPKTTVTVVQSIIPYCEGTSSFEYNEPGVSFKGSLEIKAENIIAQVSSNFELEGVTCSLVGCTTFHHTGDLTGQGTITQNEINIPVLGTTTGTICDWGSCRSVTCTGEFTLVLTR